MVSEAAKLKTSDLLDILYRWLNLVDHSCYLKFNTGFHMIFFHLLNFLFTQSATNRRRKFNADKFCIFFSTKLFESGLRILKSMGLLFGIFAYKYFGLLNKGRKKSLHLNLYHF